MNHVQRFEIKSFEEGVHSVVGMCNGYSAEVRFKEETPIFAQAILSHVDAEDKVILDYGCGVGRIAKEILARREDIRIIGLDASPDERRVAAEYVSSPRFSTIEPEDLRETVDLIYCIYVLQHVPPVELRSAIERMHYYLKPGGKLIYCSSDYRMAIALGNKFMNDEVLGVCPRIELSRLFKDTADLFDLKNSPKIIRDIVSAEGVTVKGAIPHPAIVYTRRDLAEGIPYHNVKFDYQLVKRG